MGYMPLWAVADLCGFAKLLALSECFSLLQLKATLTYSQVSELLGNNTFVVIVTLVITTTDLNEAVEVI